VKFSTLINRRLILRAYNAPSCGALVHVFCGKGNPRTLGPNKIFIHFSNIAYDMDLLSFLKVKYFLHQCQSGLSSITRILSTLFTLMPETVRYVYLGVDDQLQLKIMR